MKEEWVDELLSDAQKLLNKVVIFHPSESLPETSLEFTCTCFLFAFKENAEIRYFKGVYKLTLSLFTWHAKRCIEEKKLLMEPEVITNRFYGFLCDCIFHPDVNIPMDNLFGWCYRTIENIVQLESQQPTSHVTSERAHDFDLIYSTPSESWAIENHLHEKAYLEEQVMEALFSTDCAYTPLEKELLNLYYGENLSLSDVALKLRLSDKQASEVLRGCIFRILQKISLKSSDRPHLDPDKEERQ